MIVSLFDSSSFDSTTNARDIRCVSIVLADGQRFTIKEHKNGALLVAASMQMVITPRAANLVWLRDSE